MQSLCAHNDSCASEEYFNVILDVFNSLREWQFTIEVSNGNTWSFLDIRIIVKNNVILLDRYKNYYYHIPNSTNIDMSTVS